MTSVVNVREFEQKAAKIFRHKKAKRFEQKRRLGKLDPNCYPYKTAKSRIPHLCFLCYLLFKSLRYLLSILRCLLSVCPSPAQCFIKGFAWPKSLLFVTTQ